MFAMLPNGIHEPCKLCHCKEHWPLRNTIVPGNLAQLLNKLEYVGMILVSLVLQEHPLHLYGLGESLILLLGQEQILLGKIIKHGRRGHLAPAEHTGGQGHIRLLELERRRLHVEPDSITICGSRDMGCLCNLCTPNLDQLFQHGRLHHARHSSAGHTGRGDQVSVML